MLRSVRNPIGKKPSSHKGDEEERRETRIGFDVERAEENALWFFGGG